MFTVLVIPEGVESSDGRSYPPGLLTWRDRYEFMFTDETTEGHLGAFQVGNLENLRRQFVDGVAWIVGDLTYDGDEEAAEAMRLAQEDKIRRVSADVAQIFEETGVDEFGMPTFELVAAEIIGTTQMPMTAFGDARVLTSDEAASLVPNLITASMVAAAFAQIDEWKPPRALFEIPEPDDPAPITVYQADGFIGFYGHAAEDWGQCHLSFANCTPVPFSQSDGGNFNTRALEVDDGSKILVGPVTMGTAPMGGHADINASVSETVAHYDNANSVIAVARMSNGRLAPWLCGAVLPDVTDRQLTRFQLQQLSGDWRQVNGELDMFACLAVPIGGFGVKARVASGQIQALIAGGPKPFAPKTDLQLVVEAIEVLTARIGQIGYTLPPEDDEDDEIVHGDDPPRYGKLHQLFSA